MNMILHEKVSDALAKKALNVYGIQRFITIFSGALSEHCCTA
jgi:hypothetical protein